MRKSDKSARRRLELGRLRTANWVSEGTALPKSTPRGWRPIAVDLFQVNNCNPGQRGVKRADSAKRERSDSLSSTKSVLTYATPLEVSSAKQYTTGDAGERAEGVSQRISQLAISGDWIAEID